MHQAPVLDLDTSGEESASEEEPNHVPKKKTLKSGKVRTDDSAVLHKVVWPHKVVYTTTEQPAAYDISIPLFVSGYLEVMEAETPVVYPLMDEHLQELMGDAELCGWEPVRAFHAVWLQQLKHGWVTWPETDAKVKYRCALVWHCAIAGTKPASAPFQQPQKKLAKEGQFTSLRNWLTGLCPFDHPSFAPWCQTNSLLTRPKQDSSSR